MADDDDAPVKAHKVEKVSRPPRMSPREEMALAKSMPRGRRLVMIAKVAGVFLFAIGLEGVVTANWILAVTFLVLGTVVVLAPIRMQVTVCPKCQSRLPEGAAVCPQCGVPVM